MKYLHIHHKLCCHSICPFAIFLKIQNTASMKTPNFLPMTKQAKDKLSIDIN